MAKYRIVKQTQMGHNGNLETWFLVQKRCFWWWRYAVSTICYKVGIGVSFLQFILTFTTAEEAQAHLEYLQDRGAERYKGHLLKRYPVQHSSEYLWVDLSKGKMGGIMSYPCERSIELLKSRVDIQEFKPIVEIV